MLTDNTLHVDDIYLCSTYFDCVVTEMSSYLLFSKLLIWPCKLVCY